MWDKKRKSVRFLNLEAETNECWLICQQNNLLFVLFIDFYASKCTFIWTKNIKSILAEIVILKYIKMHWSGALSMFERETGVDTG